MATDQADQEQEKFARESERGRRSFWNVVFIAYVCAYLPQFFVFEPLWKGETLSLWWWQVVFLFQTVYSVASLQSQEANEVGAKMFFGRLVHQTEPGPVFVPLFFCSLEKESALLQQWELPTDVPELYSGEKTLRITTAFPKNEGSDEKDPLQTGRLTLEGSVVVQARLDTKVGGFYQFIKRIGSTENFLRIIDDAVVNTIRKGAARKTPSEIFEGWNDLEKEAKEILAGRVGVAGFSELEVRVKGFDLPKRVNEALADRTAAHAAVETERLKGLAQKKHDLLVAEANAALKSAEIKGVVDAIASKKAKNLGITKEYALILAQQEVMGKALEKAKYTLLPAGGGGMLDPATITSVVLQAIKANKVGGDDNE